jgi:hypothetical protein
MEIPQDVGIQSITDLFQQTMQLQNNNNDTSTQNQTPNTYTTTDPPNPCQLCINIIKPHIARLSEMTMIQLLKSFMTSFRKADPIIAILPIDSKKQDITPLVSQKQIDTLTQTHLCLYFTSRFREQHYSISGFIHIKMALSFDNLLMNNMVNEWLEMFQYSLKLCSSQDEEMSLIGALCYGSLFLYREDLLVNIIAHSTWAALNQGREKPIIIYLVVKPFCGSSKSSEMIFVRFKQSKKEEAQKALQEIYVGSIKQYPHGDVLFFIPLSSTLEDDYTPAQRDRFISINRNT